MTEDTATINSDEYMPDPRPSDFLEAQFDKASGSFTVDPFRRAVIRTSDRLQFKACRRRWGWQSHLKGNLGAKEGVSPLWFGSAIHFALEDFHGANIYGHPATAFLAYVYATRKNEKAQALPYDWKEHQTLGDGMMHYYADHWLRNRDPLKTYVHNGVPQVEVNAHIKIPYDSLPDSVKANFDEVIYSATLDRVVEDEFGLLWIAEYKTAKRMVTQHFPTDPQVGAYCWIGNILYGRPISGVIYIQFRKDVPELPRVLATGKLSLDKRQPTTHSLYRSHVAKLCGPDSKRWPGNYVEHINWLAQQETPVADAFIRRDRIERNEFSNQAEGQKILMEIEDMLNPNLPLYPNPTRFQCHFCPFQSACISMDDGGDWEGDIKEFFNPRPASHDSWRKYLPSPQLLLQAESQPYQPLNL